MRADVAAVATLGKVQDRDGVIQQLVSELDDRNAAQHPHASRPLEHVGAGTAAAQNGGSDGGDIGVSTGTVQSDDPSSDLRRL